jgi:hypothetical protein
MPRLATMSICPVPATCADVLETHIQRVLAGRAGGDAGDSRCGVAASPKTSTQVGTRLGYAHRAATGSLCRTSAHHWGRAAWSAEAPPSGESCLQRRQVGYRKFERSALGVRLDRALGERRGTLGRHDGVNGGHGTLYERVVVPGVAWRFRPTSTRSPTPVVQFFSSSPPLVRQRSRPPCMT